ncbi:nitrogen fixation protein NifM [uncultured Cohaesibacter sp.]|uniref:nitrogen fixation protein NifM n=1 Tax=uncultured Cohaesibacter sp. TaxID=1002546 RepID=UPI0029C67587|nr:nitrogen fixation protein NifM [uncultured Cohaesibacter sp.]
MTGDPLLSYHLMSASLAAHECRYDELPAGAQARIDAQARRALLLEGLVLASAVAQKVVVPQEMLNQSVALIRERYETAEAFVDDLAANGLTEAGLEQAIARELAADTVLDLVAKAEPATTDEEARDFYAAHPERFCVGETRDARHILITINEQIAENRRDAAWQRICDLQQGLTGDVEQFADAALRHSECPSALNGGALGRIPRGKLYPGLDTALFAMSAGGVSEVLESEAGFHILLCEAIYPAEMARFADAAPKIRAAIDGRRQAMAQKRFIADLLAQHHSATPQ